MLFAKLILQYHASYIPPNNVFLIEFPLSSQTNDIELRHMCQEDRQCDDELICGFENITRTTGFNRSPNAANAPKICLCDEGNGYTEDVEDNDCNRTQYNSITI